MSGIAGFFPSIFMTAFTWLFALANAMLYAEATLGNPDGANLYTISKVFLGKSAAAIIAVVFPIAMYVYISASLLSGSSFLTWFSEHYLGFEIPSFTGCFLLSLLLGAVVYLGIFASSRLNFILCVSFITAFIATVYHATMHLETHRLMRANWFYIIFAVPIIFSSFGFSALVPTLCTYLNRSKIKIQLSIFFGITGTLLIYLIWELIMIGTIGQTPLLVAFTEGQQISQAFPWVKNFPMLLHALNFIIFFAAATSIIGVTLALVDFFSDLFKIPLENRIGKKRFWVCLAVLVPPLLFTSFFESTFIPTLINYVVAPSGAFLVNGMLPIIMVAKARYFFKLQTPRLVPGEGYVLLLMGLAIFFLIYLQGVMLIQ